MIIKESHLIKTSAEEQFATWLTKQSNANGVRFKSYVANGYARNLRTEPPKLDIELSLSERDVFRCLTIAEYERLSSTFQKAPNFREVNRGANHGAFSAGLAAYRRYVQYLEANVESETGVQTAIPDATAMIYTTAQHELSVDFLTASAHKFNGAKGTGFLYTRSGVNLPRLVFGGGQEHAIRGGTENVAGIVALGYALEESVATMDDTMALLKLIVAETVSRIKGRIPDLRINGDESAKLPGTINIGFNGVSGEAVMHLLDLKGICVSTSSACTSGQDIPSHVLLALGETEEQAKSAIRISYGRYNTEDDARTVAEVICNAYDKITAIQHS